MKFEQIRVLIFAILLPLTGGCVTGKPVTGKLAGRTEMQQTLESRLGDFDGLKKF